MVAARHESASYRSVDITQRLHERAAPPRDETPTLLALTQTIAGQPERALQALVESAMVLTSAQSAGISITDVEGTDEVFRWVATGGQLAGHAGGTMPRWFSPCGDVLRVQHQLLMEQPVRHYPYIAQLGLPIHEALLSPIRREDVPVGTVWVVMHDDSRRFDAEDARVLRSLTQFVGDTADLLDRLSFGLTL